MIKKTTCKIFVFLVTFLSILGVYAGYWLNIDTGKYFWLNLILDAICTHYFIVGFSLFGWAQYIRMRHLDEVHDAVDPVRRIVRKETGAPYLIDAHYLIFYACSATGRWMNGRLMPDFDMHTLSTELTLPLKIGFWLEVYLVSAMVVGYSLMKILEYLEPTILL